MGIITISRISIVAILLFLFIVAIAGFEFSPVITNVTTTDITTNYATIHWDTDNPSDSIVKYGTSSGNYMMSERGVDDVTSHTVHLTGLNLNTTYYFVVNSTDASGKSNQSAEYKFITSVNPPPIASFTYSPGSLIVNQPITFDASSSTDPDGTIVNYEWDFGDGSTAIGITATHSYSTSGTYDVSLMVTDDKGATNTTFKKISAIVENNTSTSIFTIFGFIDPLHLILLLVIFTLVVYVLKIRGWWDKIKKRIKSKREYCDKNIALTTAIVDIATEAGIGDIDLQTFDDSPLEQHKKKIIEKISANKTEINGLKNQLRDTEENTYIRNIADLLHLQGISYDEPPNKIFDKIINSIQSTQKIKSAINNAYSQISFKTKNLSVDEDNPAMQLQKITTYVIKLENFKSTIKSLVQIEIVGLSPTNDDESTLQTTINNELIQKVKEGQQQLNVQKEFLKVYEQVLTKLEELKGEITDGKCIEYLNNAIKYIESNDLQGVKQYLDLLIAEIKELYNENKSFKNKMVIINELDKTNVTKIEDVIGRTSELLAQIKSNTGENKIEILNIIEKVIKQLDKQISNVDDMNESFIIKKHTIMKQADIINDLLIKIKDSIKGEKPPAVTIEDVNKLLKKSEYDLAVLENNRNSKYRDTCHNEIPKHYKEFASELIEECKRNCHEGKYPEAKILAEAAQRLIKSTNELYEKPELRSLLEMIRTYMREHR